MSVYDLEPDGQSTALAAPVVAATTLTSGLTPAARVVFDQLLEIGAARPVMDSGLVDSLKQHISSQTLVPLSLWTESSLFLTKSSIAAILRCEGQAAAAVHFADNSVRKLIPSVVVGQVSHIAVQLSYTHPGFTVSRYVDEALKSQIEKESGFASSWEELGMVSQSDLRTSMISRATAFLDSFPPLRPEWNPRFEESMITRIGKLTLSARPDLILGRPRADLTQSIIVCDFKTGALRDEYEEEAGYYGLVATLKYGVAPYKSFIYSLASCENSGNEFITRDRLFAAADRVIAGCKAHVEVMCEVRDAQLSPGKWCSWCPLATSCPASSLNSTPSNSQIADPVSDTTPEDLFFDESGAADIFAL